jgi:MFS family permease
METDPPNDTKSQAKSIFTQLKEGAYPFYKLLFINLKFRWIFLSSFVSTIGNYFSEVAIMSLVSSHSGRNGGFGLIGIYLCTMVPPIMLMLVTGIVADRFDKRKIMYFSDITRSCLVLCLFLIGSIWDLKKYFWVTYIILFMMISAGSFFDPAREGFTHFIVDKEELITATTLDGITWMTCTVIGASTGGLVTGIFGAQINFLIDSMSFLVSAFFVVQLFAFEDLAPHRLRGQIEKEGSEKTSQVDAPSEVNAVVTEVTEPISMTEEVMEPPQENEQERLTETVESTLEDATISLETPLAHEKPESFFSTLKQEFLGLFFGIRYLLQHPYLLTLVCIKGFFSCFFVNLEFVILKFGEHQFKIGEDAAIMYGISKTLIGISAALGPVVLVLFFNMTGKRMRTLIFVNTIIQIGGFLILWWSPNVWVFLIGTTIVGGSVGIPWGFSTALVQQNCPKEILGRVMAVDYGFILNFMNILSTILCGLCLDLLNFTPNQVALLGVGFGTILFIYYGIWLFLTRHLD